MEVLKKEKELRGKSCSLAGLIIAFLLGTVLGFLLAPVKKGVYCGNNNGNTVHNHGEENEPPQEWEAELAGELETLQP